MTDKKIIYGQRVNAGGKEGIVREVADKIKVKFDDGSFSFFALTEITPVVEETRLKGRYDRMKAENKLNGETFMSAEATGKDPLA